MQPPSLTPHAASPKPPFFGVYIHFPFCRAKCGYCDFASIPACDIPHAAYADLVLSELAARAEVFADGQLRSIYFGGGTPSLWDPNQVARVVSAVLQTFAHAESVEITLEVNPGTARQEVFQQLAGCGVNRLSIGVQSLDDDVLRLLTRIHTRHMAQHAVADARQAGFANINCDLMFGLPGQTVEHHLEQLQGLLELGPNHVSVYGLSLSPTAPLRLAGLAPAEDDLLADMMEAGRSVLEAAGFFQYEVSNYAPHVFRSAHNALVWAGRPYLGLGASAHSMFFAGPVTTRVINPDLPYYLQAKNMQANTAPSFSAVGSPCAVIETITEPTSRWELLILGLRTVDGVDREAYRFRFGRDILDDHFGPRLNELSQLGLVQVSEHCIAPTARGIWLADELALRLAT